MYAGMEGNKVFSILKNLSLRLIDFKNVMYHVMFKITTREMQVVYK